MTAPKADRLLDCIACGMRVTGKEDACPRCGKKFEKGIKFKCPSCGGSISNRWRKCPLCQADLVAASPKAATKPAPKKKVTLEKEVTELEPSPLVGEDKLEPVPPESAPAEVQRESISVAESADTHPCRFCGTSIQVDLQECPACGMSIVETKAETAVPEPELPEVPRIQDSAIAPGKAEAKVTGRVKRSLKVPSAAPPPATIQSSDRGLVNGTGHINGLRRVDGTGAVNGRAFVNGTGISNGLAGRPQKTSAKRTSFLAKWQFLAVLLAIVIVIPTFVFLTYPTNPKEFAIDGDFDDWNSATVYSAKIPSVASSNNVTGWSVGTQGTDLYFHFMTQAPMMSSSIAESYYLLVDSDGSNDTGYIVESIGADYMLRLTGWDSTVQSTSLSEYSSSSDQYDWNKWESTGSLSFSVDSTRLEASATMPVVLEKSAKFVLVSKDSEDRGSVSYTAPLKGGLLIVQQAPTTAVATTGIVSRAASVEMLTLRFTCDGEGGKVSQINPTLSGALAASQAAQFSLAKGDEMIVTVELDTSAAIDGQLVSAEVFASNIDCNFESVEIIGSGARAYVESPPSAIAVDGAFADWNGRLSVDSDPSHVADHNLDILEVGNLSDSSDSLFYVSVEGEICSGTFIPATVSKPSGGSGGGGGIKPRHTAEDILNIYVDSDRFNATGEAVDLGLKRIGADQMIEVRGLFGRITSTKEFDYELGAWVLSAGRVEAAKDEQRIEIGVSATSLGGSSDIDFIVETTSWKGRGDLATFDPTSMKAMTMTWVVDPTSSSPYATSMSYQRKMFYDGLNYWSFFFDGRNTVCKYSIDDGQTWVSSGRVFTTPGVNETSIWYDSSTSTVYAIGDTSLSTNNVSIQVGTVDPAARSIKWASSDSSLNTSTVPMPGKNTFISKDTNGYLWVLSSNFTSDKPVKYWLNAFKSRNVNSTDFWTETGEMLPWYLTSDNAKGSIVPAGSGGDVWSVYVYGGYVSARKYNGTWSADQRVYTLFGSTDNTDNSPPSVVVDKKGVVHVVLGTGQRIGGGVSTPEIMYSHNDTNRINFTTGLNLDPFVPKGVGGYYPTISLDASTGNLYVLWLQNILNDPTYSPRTVIGRICVSGAWSNMTILPQTTFTKQYLTSIYSVSGEYKICWQWTQNTTAPIDVMFDGTMIPEISDLALPLIMTIVVFAVLRRRSRGKDDPGKISSKI
jgi:hypothetical protein